MPGRLVYNKNPDQKEVNPSARFPSLNLGLSKKNRSKVLQTFSFQPGLPFATVPNKYQRIHERNQIRQFHWGGIPEPEGAYPGDHKSQQLYPASPEMFEIAGLPKQNFVHAKPKMSFWPSKYCLRLAPAYHNEYSMRTLPYRSSKWKDCWADGKQKSW